MSDALLKSKQILLTYEYTFVAYSDNNVITSSERGVKPLLDLINTNFTLENYSVSDKVIGKAAAFLYVLLKAKNVYACTASNLAADVFKRYDINFRCDNIVPAIRNRTDTGFCPMETAVIDITEPDEAFAKIKETLVNLKRTQGGS